MRSVIVLVITLVCMSNIVNAQNIPETKEATTHTEKINTGEVSVEDKQKAIVEPTLEERLIALSESITSSEKSLAELESQLKKESDEAVKTRLIQEITETNDIISGMRDEYVDVATNGMRLYPEKRNTKSAYDWRVDLELIVRPMLDQLKELTERPRKVEQLESDIKYWKRREINLSQSITALNDNLKVVENKQQQKKLKALLDTAMSRYQKANKKLKLLKSEIQKQAENDVSIWTTVVEGSKSLFVNMGLNLSIALGAALCVYYVVGLLGILPTKLLKTNHKQYIFLERSVKLIKHIVGTLLASLVYITILYVQAEWVVLLLSIGLLFAFLLGMKGVLPRYLVEIRTLLNLGSIRQDERLYYKGLPWKVSRLDIYTHLHNPNLDGHFRVPLTELSRLSSRPYHKDEPWFPTKTGDYVMLSDGAFGMVLRQTPEQIQLEFGRSITTYTCHNFLNKSPNNFSTNGFSVTQVLGFDYNLQEIITSTVLNVYSVEMKEFFDASDFAEDINAVTVEFHKAGMSSLDFRVILSVNGKAAKDYYAIKRLIHRASIEIANKNDWIVPFQQITVHHSHNEE